ncbi:uncharacterized protein HI_1246-like [Globicephala melas]|uniref:uncharacterized protein HI_1246-like n=1 Tax=Globicephala melas TaxID=9731 RepID=UPI0038738DF6
MQHFKQIDRAIYLRVALQILLVYLFYMLSRLTFFAYNHDIIHINSWGNLWTILRGGLFFDTAAIAYTNSVIVLLQLIPFQLTSSRPYQAFIKWCYYLINIPFFILNQGDIIYSRFSAKRTGLSVFKEFANENVFGFFNFFVDYWHLTLITLIFIGFWIALYPNNFKLKPLVRKVSAWYYYSSSAVAILVLTALTIIGARGGVGNDLPITPSRAMKYTERAEQMNMVLNTPFGFLRLMDVTSFPEYQFMDKAEALSIFNPLRQADQKPTAHTGQFRGRNVVLIIWESLSKEWVGDLNQDLKDYKGYTPFVDKLLKKSYYFEAAYANGVVSIDAMPALLASTPRPLHSFVHSFYSANRLPSLPRLLKGAGYHTAYFHNAHTGSMGFDAMAKRLGYEQYIGREDFGDDTEYDGRWGIWDEPFLQFMITKLKDYPQPFFATEFTTSSHDPFDVPTKYIDKFPEGASPYHKVISYTDYALEQFFREASQQAWYDNTLFIITADHSVRAYREEYKNSRGAYSIPFIFFDPRGELVGADQATIVQQTDLMPTLLDLLGISEATVSFGHNMFSSEEPHFAVSTNGNNYQIVKGDYLLVLSGQEVFALYNYKEDTKLEHNLRGQDLAEEEDLRLTLGAYLQSFSERLRFNTLSTLTP